MTLSTTQNTRTYTGDNSTVAFSFPYLFYSDSDITVTIDGVQKTLNGGGAYDFTVTGVENPAGGTVTFNNAPLTGVTIVIQRIVDYNQETDFENFDGNPAEVTEKQFDLVVMQTQQLAEQQNRTILTPVTTVLDSNIIGGTIDSTARALTITTAGLSTSLLASFGSDLDVILTSETSGDLLQYNGSNWVNTTTLTGDLTISGDNTHSGDLTLSGTNTHSGNNTFSGDNTFNNAIATPRVNRTTSAGLNLDDNLVLNAGGGTNATLKETLLITGRSGSSAHILLQEDTDNGTNTVTIEAPAALGEDRTITLPDKDGTVALLDDTGIITAWTTYTPAFTGFGTVSGLNAKYRRVGDDVEVMVTFTTGTVTAVIPEISLPSGLTIDSGVIGTRECIGHGARATVGGLIDIVIGTGGDTTVETSLQGTAGAGLTPINASSAYSSSSKLSFKFSVPVTGW